MCPCLWKAIFFGQRFLAINTFFFFYFYFKKAWQNRVSIFYDFALFHLISFWAMNTILVENTTLRPERLLITSVSIQLKFTLDSVSCHCILGSVCRTQSSLPTSMECKLGTLTLLWWNYLASLTAYKTELLNFTAEMTVVTCESYSLG